MAVNLHASYISNLAPVDFRLLPKLKEVLKRNNFSSDTEVQVAVRNWIQNKPESLFVDGMKKWIWKNVCY